MPSKKSRWFAILVVVAEMATGRPPGMGDTPSTTAIKKLPSSEYLY